METNTSNPEVLYGDTFDVVTRYCFTFVSPSVTKVVANMKIVWKKQTMFKCRSQLFFLFYTYFHCRPQFPVLAMITKLTNGAMKEVMKEMAESVQTSLNRSGGSDGTQPSSQDGAAPVITNTTPAPLSVSQQASTAPFSIEDMSLNVKVAVVGSCFLSFLLLAPMISRLFFHQPDLSLRIAYALRCAVFSSTPLPLVLITGSSLGGDSGLYSRLTLFFVLNLVTLSTFVEIGNHMNVLFLFSLYFLTGSVTLIAAESLFGLRGFSNPGVLLCSTSVLLLILYNIGLSVFGQ